MDFTDILKALDAPIGIIVLFMLAGVRRDVKALHKRTNRIEHRLWPADDDATPPHGPGTIGGAAAVFFALVLILPGCTWRAPAAATVAQGAADGAKVGAPFGPVGELVGGLAGAALAIAGGYKVGHKHGKRAAMKAS